MKKLILQAIMIFVGCHFVSAQSLCEEIHGGPLTGTFCISGNSSTIRLPISDNKQYNAAESIRTEMIEAMTDEERTPPVSAMSVKSYVVPKMEFSRAKGRNLLQTLGFIAVGVTRVLAFPTASDHPDL